MEWSEFERSAARLAAVAHARLIEPGVLLVATIRRDGTPRLSPVEPFLLDGQLWLSMLWQSRKAADLLRDDRVLLHSIITSRDGANGEVKIRGHAVAIEDQGLRARYRDAVVVLGWQPTEPYFHLFRIELDDVTAIRYADSGDQYVARWPERVEFVRPATTATSVGAAQPLREMFAD